MKGGDEFVSDSGARRRRWAIRIAIVTAAGLLLARLGPFGTFEALRGGERLAYWVGLTMLQWLVSLAMLSVLQPVQMARTVRLIAAALMASLPVSFAVAWAEMLLRVERDLGLVDILQIAGDVALIGVPLLLVTHSWPVPERPTPASAGDEAGLTTLLAQVPPDRRGRLLALAAEDHYVRLITERGSHLLLMRFSDAVASLQAGSGCRVHRGWWVAKGAATAVRAGESWQLRLPDGTAVPVSRTYLRDARDAGLLPPP